MAEPLTVRPLLPRPPAPAYHPFQLHHRVFTPAQCRRIVDLGRSLPGERGTLESGDATDGLRDSATAWIAPQDAPWVFTKLARVAERANRTYRFDLTGFEEDLQFTSYDRPGAFYTWHQDGLDGPVAHRKLSLVVQLSDPDDYEGGELELFEVAHDYDEAAREAFGEQSTRQGSVVVFPSLELHRVLPLRSGVRHSLVCWVSGPPFR